MSDRPFAAAITAPATVDERGVALHFGDAAVEAATARRGSAIVDAADHGVLDIRGRDRVSLLQRITANDLMKLAPGRLQRNCFTSAKGRVIDWSRLLLIDDAVRIITSPGRAGAVRAWLDRYTIIEDITVDDRCAQIAPLRLIGKGARDVAARIADTDAPDANGYTGGHLGDVAVQLLGSEPIADAAAWLLLVPTDHAVSAARWLIEECAATFIGELAWDALRIEAGLPRSGHEITEERNPLELGLWNSVAFDKGCYVGQEVLARLRNYDKIMSQLALLELSAPAAAGAALLHEGKPVGELTSTTAPPIAEAARGLGLVKRRVVQAGGELAVGDPGTGITAKVVRVIDLRG